ncbi:peroxidase, partial [Glutamicibacter creatinolyticus]
HVARAMPASGDEVLWRRGYSYQEGGSAGLLFASYQVDVARSFIPVQTRLAELDALNEWTTPIGSAVYGVLPGISQGMYLGQQLFQAAGH